MSNGGRGDGATASRRWCYTNFQVPDVAGDFDPDGDFFEVLLDVFPTATFHAWQFERSDSGRFHQQGYLVFSRSERLSYLRRCAPGVHFEPSRGTHEQALAYVSKDDTREAGPFREGVEPAGKGARTDLEGAIATLKANLDLRQVADAHPAAFVKYHRGFEALRSCLIPQERPKTFRCLVFWGPSGFGKTSHIEETEKDLYRIPDNSCQWWNGYTGQKAVLLDEFSGETPFAYLLRIMDRYPLTVATKGGFVPLTCETLWITSQECPSKWIEKWYRKELENPERTVALLRRISEVYCETRTPPGFIPPSIRWPSESPGEIPLSQLSAIEALQRLSDAN